MKVVADAAVTAAVANGATRTYLVGDVPPLPETPYAVVSTDAGVPSNYRPGAITDTRLVNLSLQAFGKTHNEAEYLVDIFDRTFEGHELSGPGFAPATCSRTIGTSIERDPDGEVLMQATHVYTLTTRRTDV